MDIGTGIAIAGSVTGITVPTAAVWITVLKTKATSGNGKSNSTVYLECAKHSGIEEMLKALKEGQDEIKENIKGIFERLNNFKARG
ncbi:MAG: hypothetical protein A4E65_02329 [Syntrophorhabdus sp. PtaU1.Bin153]|nr:MAG: hypothetical protein A4E65_02329 [Syntrophorhabdus sp. PtaU1.Bin153]